MRLLQSVTISKKTLKKHNIKVTRMTVWVQLTGLLKSVTLIKRSSPNGRSFTYES